MDSTEESLYSTEFLDGILSCIQQPVIVTDLEGHILFANPAIDRALGFTPDELKGNELSMVFTPEDMTYLYPNLLYLARKNKPFEGELMLKHKDETRSLAFVALHTFEVPGREERAVVLCIQDIDRLKKIKKTFSVSTYEDLIKIADGIAHELRNPLVGIGGFINRLYKLCSAVSEHGKYYEYIIDNLRKIEGLVKKVEFFARIPEPCLKEESMGEFTANVIKPHLQKIEKRMIDLDISMDEASLLVDGDLLARAINVILQNALDAMDEGGTIRIRGMMEDSQYRIDISDTGRGISPEDMPYIFNPFFSTKADGAGIDLAAVKRIMDGHGGHIEVSSTPGEGTTFSLFLPLERRRAIRISRLEDAAAQKPDVRKTAASINI